MLGTYFGKKILPEKTLLIFDEIQETPRALTSLKYFAEKAPLYHICCAGSLLGVALHKGTSFPVGKVDFLTLHPLSFEEFLLANKQDDLIHFIRQNELSAFPAPFVSKLTDYLKYYYIIGGMPTAVATWIETKDIAQVEERQRAILDAYQQDFSKHAPPNIVPKLRLLWNSIPTQLAKENKKFIYGLIREGARARDYEDALLWLLDSGLLRKVSRVSKGSLPLKAYEDLRSFKLYHNDVGLLRVLSGLSPRTIIENVKIFEEFKGAITEQYILQELSVHIHEQDVYYWTSDAQSEVDFLITEESAVYPLEVKAGENLKSKSLQVYRSMYNPPLALRTSLSNIRFDNGLLNIPLYAFFNYKGYIAKAQKKRETTHNC